MGRWRSLSGQARTNAKLKSPGRDSRNTHTHGHTRAHARTHARARADTRAHAHAHSTDTRVTASGSSPRASDERVTAFFFFSQGSTCAPLGLKRGARHRTACVRAPFFFFFFFFTRRRFEAKDSTPPNCTHSPFTSRPPRPASLPQPPLSPSPTPTLTSVCTCPGLDCTWWRDRWAG